MKIVRSPFLAGAFALSALLLSSCASMTGAGSYQVVLVRSEPSGAKIISDGVDLGKTPKFVLLRNQRNLKVELERGSEKVEVPLSTKYRYRDSLFDNLIFFTYAPVGWVIDLMTGKAWEIEDSPVVEFKTTQAEKKSKSKIDAKTPLSVAIAPPRSDFLSLADTSGKSLETQIPLLAHNVSVRPYDSTLTNFTSHGYDYDSRPSEVERRELYYSLGVDAIYESEVEMRGNTMVLNGRLKNVYTGETSPTDQLKTYSPESEVKIGFLNELFHRLIPNNLGLDLIEEHLEVTQGTQTYSLAPAPENEWWEQGLQYINAVDLSSLPPRRQTHSLRGLWSFVPSFRFSRKRVFLSGAPSDEQQAYTRLLVSGGYGIEGGVQIERHYFYGDLIPLFYWSQISWQKGSQGFSATDTGIGAQAELGYLIFLNSHWNLRLFTRAISEDSSGWSDALSSSLPKARGDVSVTSHLLGVAIAYRFETNPGRSWNPNGVSVSRPSED